jgi:hypothetical protein
VESVVQRGGVRIRPSEDIAVFARMNWPQILSLNREQKELLRELRSSSVLGSAVYLGPVDLE